MRVLTVNTGSSSVKLALYDGEQRVWAASADNPFATAAHLPEQAPDAVGHRIVAPLSWTAPKRLDAEAEAELRKLVPLALDHLPQALAAVQAARAKYPRAGQAACSDSAFHQTLPPVARATAVPLAGLRRYGYHGLSCEYIMSVLRDEFSRVIIAHLGSGCSLTAVRDGRSIETTMGFSPLGGLVMSTRSGDVDPGLLLAWMDRGASPEEIRRGLNQGSGLRAISGMTGDMKTLLECDDPRALFAVEVFVYRARKHLGALMAVLGGLDMLVFTGGIGEHAEAIRRSIALDLPFRTIATDEDRMIARHTRQLLEGP